MVLKFNPSPTRKEGQYIKRLSAVNIFSRHMEEGYLDSMEMKFIETYP